MITALFFSLLPASQLTAGQTAIEALRDAVIRAETSEKASNAYKALFTKHWPSDIGLASKESNTSIALHSVWEASHRPQKHFDKNTHWHWRYDPVKTQQFVDFFRKRTSVSIPTWWQKTILNTEMEPGRGSACFGPLPHGQASSFIVQKDSIAVMLSGQKVGSLPLSTEILAFDAIRWKDQALVVVIPLGGPGKLYLFGPDAKTIVWRTDVWATGRWTVNGVVIEMVSLVLNGDSVAVFGEAGTAYAESFNATTGKSIFRFNTSYWQNWSESWKR